MCYRCCKILFGCACVCRNAFETGLFESYIGTAMHLNQWPIPQAEKKQVQRNKMKKNIAGQPNNEDT